MGKGEKREKWKREKGKRGKGERGKRIIMGGIFHISGCKVKQISDIANMSRPPLTFYYYNAAVGSSVFAIVNFLNTHHARSTSLYGGIAAV